jgi:endonuclease/exonuclease/phosphatase family metal-dependent hydrolase
MYRAEGERVEVATLNFELCKALSMDGLQKVMDADILLCQEITKFPAGQLWEAGFDLVDYMPKAGLAIAKRRGSGLELVPGAMDRQHTLQQMGKRETALVAGRTGRGNPFRERGIQIVPFRTRNGRTFTVANTHPSPPIVESDRKRQIRQMPGLLKKVIGPLVFGGDFNQYGRRKIADEQMRSDAGVSKVDIGDTHTWDPSPDSGEGRVFGRMAKLRGVPIEEYGGQLDALYYRGGVRLVDADVVPVKQSDHDAITATFTLTS